MSMGVSNCAGIQPNWDATFYRCDPERQSLVRWEDGQILDEIDFSDEVVPQYICTHQENLQKLQDEVLNACEKWGSVPNFEL